MIEWEANSLIGNVNNTILNGGSDADLLYGNDGIDIFTFTDTDAVDTVFGFDVTQNDALDISSIISYDALNDDINDFIQLTVSGGDTTISIDADGTSNGSNYTDIAVLEDTSGLDLSLMLASDNLIV